MYRKYVYLMTLQIRCKEMNVKMRVKAILKLCFMTSIFCQPVISSAEVGNLNIVVKTAPIVPHGLLVGKPLDVTLSFVDLDPAVPGIAIKKGGTIRIDLPKEIINTGFPVSKPGGAKGCEPPVLARCSSGGMLDGWPQSPLLPIGDITYDEASHSLLLTAPADAPPYSVEAPGLKLVHLFTFGFMNPDEPGEYPIALQIRPDPASEELVSGKSMLVITDQQQPNIAIDTTQSVHIKGPRYQNTMFQTLSPGSTSRNMSSNLWDEMHAPIVGASIAMTDINSGNLISEDGGIIGTLDIQAPADAKGYYLMSTPSFATKTGLAGFPAGRIVTALKTASKTKGTYVVTLSLNGGNQTVHTVRVQ